MTRLLAEDLLLLCWDDEKGVLHQRCSMAVGPGIGGALVIDAVLAGALAITDDRVQVTGTDPGDPMLADVVAAADRRRPPSVAKLVQQVGTTSRYKAVRDRLVGRGVLLPDHRRMLGVVPYTRYPSADPVATEAVRETVRTLLTGSADAGPREAVLAGLARPTSAVDVLVARGARARAHRRAEALGAGVGTSAVVGLATRDPQGAAMAAVTAAVAAGAAASVSGYGSGGWDRPAGRSRLERPDPGADDGQAPVEEPVVVEPAPGPVEEPAPGPSRVEEPAPVEDVGADTDRQDVGVGASVGGHRGPQPAGDPDRSGVGVGVGLGFGAVLVIWIGVVGRGLRPRARKGSNAGRRRR